MPKLEEEIELYRSAVDDELRSLPESFAENPQVKLLALFDEFITCVKDFTKGNESRPEFFKGLYKEFEKLAADITATCPKFDICILSTNRSQQRKKNTLTAKGDSDSNSSDFDPVSRESQGDRRSGSEFELDGEPNKNETSRLLCCAELKNSYDPSVCPRHNQRNSNAILARHFSPNCPRIFHQVIRLQMGDNLLALVPGCRATSQKPDDGAMWGVFWQIRKLRASPRSQVYAP